MVIFNSYVKLPEGSLVSLEDVWCERKLCGAMPPYILPVYSGWHTEVDRHLLILLCYWNILRVSINGGEQNSWMFFFCGKSQSKIDDNWRYPHFRKPPCWNLRQLNGQERLEVTFCSDWCAVFSPVIKSVCTYQVVNHFWFAFTSFTRPGKPTKSYEESPYFSIGKSTLNVNVQ